MQCQNCGDATSPAVNECQRCRTPLGQPAIAPGVPTYPVRGLGTAAAIAVGVASLLYLPSGLFPVFGIRFARAAAEREDRDLLLGAAVAEVLLTLVFLLAVLTAAVLVIIWTWRVRTNLEAFPGALPTLSPAWAIAGWLVPFANIVMPARVVANVARDSLGRRGAPALVGLWWTAWLVFNGADRILAYLDEQRYSRLTQWPRSETEFATYVRYYQDALGPRVIPVVACVVAGASFIVLIRRISLAQQERIAKAAPIWPGHPGGVVPPPAPASPTTGGTIGT
ncbi:DUF4328 domain-containing protein [Micromonospora sp. C31]|uniref:DUF4328 domain-containing protein n=1 Tax=Micromonospora sp. C31 TaxID=2824876 RepID=UPI001B391810|nr:DUF4328 domain-containing protein [Micromonospora sp. C31]MBQ1072149.1 DUF4328 domain-containing protein [Micromonospora sp. C31]